MPFKLLILALGFALQFSSVYSDTLNCPCKVVKESDGDTVHVLDQSREKDNNRI